MTPSPEMARPQRLADTVNEKVDALVAKYYQGYALGLTEDPCSPDFRGAWNHCDDLGIPRDSAECNFFTEGFIKGLSARHRPSVPKKGTAA